MIRSPLPAVLLAALIAAAPPPCHSQSKPNLQTFLQQNVGLTLDQIAAIRNGQPVTTILPSRTPAEVLLFGAVYIRATPESYRLFAKDFDRLRRVPNYLALGAFSTPPQLSDLKGFSLDQDEVQALKGCEPRDCAIQIPAGWIEDLHRDINWSAPDVDEQVNHLFQKAALERLIAYQREGNQALGVYNDKREPTEVPRQFTHLLSYSKVFPERLPDLYHYLLAYPKAKPANIEDMFYWARVTFGLKPTLRVVHVVTMHGAPADQVAYVIAEKQLYASHYFMTALDLSFCVRGSDDPKQPGFYLIMVLGSEQAGLTGVKGSIVRKVALNRSVSSLRAALTTIKNTLEGNH